MNILIADDNEDVRLLQETVLATEGYTVHSAANGLEALKLARYLQPDMIISDIMMPEMDGFELCRTVKSDKKLRTIPFIFYSATFKEEGDKRLAMAMGASSFIVKPAELDAFLNTINKVLEECKQEKIPIPDGPRGSGALLGHMHNERVSRKLLKKNRELAEENRALKESEERYALAVRGANDGIWDRNLKTGEVYYSPRWKEMLGYGDDEIENERSEWKRRVHPDDYDRVMRDINEHLKGRTGHYRSEYRMRHKDGSYRWILARGATVRDESCNPTRIAGSHTDITGRKQAEEERKSLEAQLIQAQKMETIGTLAGGIAHDFNNILQPILGYGELIRRALPEESQALDDLSQLSKSVARAADLVRQILRFSRHDEHERKVLDISPVVRDVAKLIRSTVPATIEIREKISADCGHVMADPAQIHQVLMNLCTNACHAMLECGGTLDICLRAVEVDEEFARLHLHLKPGDYVRVSISDTGHGMDAETMARIFDPFFTTKEVGKGTGLGLSVVHGIVLSHGGEITVESLPGKGSVFDVYLPVADAACTLEERAGDEDLIPEGSESILFVDDESDISLVVKPLLECQGYSVATCSSPAEALEKFRADPDAFDVVITDYTMPNMIGTRLSMELQRIRPDIPVILTSGFNEFITPKDFKQFGISEYVMKPFNARQLGRVIRRVLDR